MKVRYGFSTKFCHCALDTTTLSRSYMFKVIMNHYAGKNWSLQYVIAPRPVLGSPHGSEGGPEGLIWAPVRLRGDLALWGGPWEVRGKSSGSEEDFGGLRWTLRESEVTQMGLTGTLKDLRGPLCTHLCHLIVVLC